MNWKETHKDIGRVKEGSKNFITYNYTGELPAGFRVVDLEASCGCTTPSFNPAKKELKLEYKAGRVPQHLRSKGEMHSGKKVTMTTDTGKMIFTFGATIFI